jgi:ferredoxin
MAWEEGCLRCAECVKDQCIYNVYHNRGLDPDQMIDSIDNQCMNCLRCVQGCPKELIHKSVNPEFNAMGDSHWTPDIIASLWYQAETGKIPVSGAGYPGPFSGPGFDSMWTDMSEIIRPTRDGIHGREYISTGVDIVETPLELCFTENGEMSSEPPGLIHIPLPIVMRVPSFGSYNKETIKGWAMAAERLGTFLALPWDMNIGPLDCIPGRLMPLVSSSSIPERVDNKIEIVELLWDENYEKAIVEIGKIFPSALICVRLPLGDKAEEMALSLSESGCSIINLEADFNGRMQGDGSRFLKEGVRSVHEALVGAGIRDRMTVFASGGLAMAEHVAKSIICGADAVFVDFPILIALECRMCGRCKKGLPCPVRIEEASSGWVAARTINIMGSWHDQLLEVMGAMGIRDIRRLRGEAGRAIFLEDIEKEIFLSLGVVGEGYELE